MMQSGVYIIRNTISGKFYVGSSAVVHERCEQHFYSLSLGTHHNKHLQAAYVKYGERAFVFEVLEHCDEATMYEREQYYLDTLQAVELGYNIAREVLVPPREPLSVEAREKIRVAMTGRTISAETRARMSASRRARGPQTEQQKNRASEAMMRYWRRKEAEARGEAV